MELKVSMIGDREVNEYLKRCAQKFPTIVKRRLLVALTWIERAAHENLFASGIDRKSGQLERGTKVKGPTGRGADLEGKVVSPEMPGVFIEEGTKPHIIRAKNKRALFFDGKWGMIAQVKQTGSARVGRRYGYRTTTASGRAKTVEGMARKSVKHPGTKATHYMTKAFQENRPKILDLFAKVPEELEKA